MQTPLLDDWPTVTLDSLENIEMEDDKVRFVYRSFFKLMRLPETTVRSFFILLTHGTE